MLEILVFIAWAVGATISAWLTMSGVKLAKSSQSGEFNVSLKKDGIQINGRLKAGLFLSVVGICSLVLLIYLYWQVVFYLAALSAVVTLREVLRRPADHIDV